MLVGPSESLRKIIYRKSNLTESQRAGDRLANQPAQYLQTWSRIQTRDYQIQ